MNRNYTVVDPSGVPLLTFVTSSRASALANVQAGQVLVDSHPPGPSGFRWNGSAWVPV